MIIDADCHISSQKWDNLAITAGELAAGMDRAGVDQALIWLKPPYDKNYPPENQAVFQANRDFPGRLFPLAGPIPGWAWNGPPRPSGVVRGIRFSGYQIQRRSG